MADTTTPTPDAPTKSPAEIFAEYIEKHRVKERLEEAMNVGVQGMPEDPLAAIAAMRFFRRSSDRTDATEGSERRGRKSFSSPVTFSVAGRSRRLSVSEASEPSAKAVKAAQVKTPARSQRQLVKSGSETLLLPARAVCRFVATPRTLGTGAYGAVLQGTAHQTAEPVAIKFIAEGQAGGAACRRA